MSLHNAVGHFRTITKHKMMVMENCFLVGLYKQGQVLSGDEKSQRGGKGGSGIFCRLASPQGKK